mmetsp:Transcript_15446/g.31286  ORF Transcript_15446/g.31286 Transcript_15446/m.31286 type:complete len:220 (+) Transcript_15446:57-716(+)
MKRAETLLAEKVELVVRLEETVEHLTGDQAPKSSGLESDWGSWGKESALVAGATPSNDSLREPSMLDIVAGQRDRFRARTLELEDENQKLLHRLEEHVAEVENMRSDNVQLFEKIRFLESYDSGTVVVKRDDDGVLSKYRAMYEDLLNPYAVFNRRERQRKLTEMSVPERMTVRTGQRLLSSRNSRLFVFFYMLGLHIYVISVLSFSRNDCLEPAPVGT